MGLWEMSFKQNWASEGFFFLFTLYAQNAPVRYCLKSNGSRRSGPNSEYRRFGTLLTGVDHSALELRGRIWDMDQSPVPRKPVRLQTV